MTRILGQAVICSGVVLVLATTAASTAQAVNFGGYIPFGSSLKVQMYRAGVPVTTPLAVGDDSASMVSQFSQGIAKDPAHVTFGLFSNPAPEYMQFHVIQGSLGPATYALNYNNPADPDDPLNGLPLDISSLAVNLLGTAPIAGGVFDPNGLTFTLNIGSLKILDPDDPFNPIVVNLANHSGPIAGAGNATFIQGTYTIPILADVPISTPFGNLDAVFSGTVQLASLPEPGTLALAGLGLLAAVPVLRRRLSRARS